MNLKSIQAETGTAPDGIFGPATAAALAAARYDVVLDAGHTADHAREHPAAWPAGTWDSPWGRPIAAALGITPATADSLEHRLNLAISTACAAALRQMGHRVLLYDDPTLPNTAEYRLAARIANAARPRAFVSVHANASRGIATTAQNTACGTITYHRPDHTPSRTLALLATGSLLALRAEHAAPHNRADKALPGPAYHVLTATPAAGASILIETGFYDHAADLTFLATCAPSIGQALAAAIHAHLTANA